MTIADYDSVRALLLSTPGVTVRSADSREATERYLIRNPELSFVARMQGHIVGCVMCGHDGRRGYLQHLAVAPSAHRGSIGTTLVARCLEALRRIGIEKAHIDVVTTNTLAHAYWTSSGWKKRDDIVRYSLLVSTDQNS